MHKTHTQVFYSLLLLGMLLLQPLPGSAANCVAPDIVSADSLVRLILDCNKHQQALINQHQADQHYRAAAGHLDDPQLSLGIAPLTFGEAQLDNAYTVELNQSIPWPGVLNLRAQLADDQMSLSQAQLEQFQVDLALQVRLLYAQYQHQCHLLRINQQHHRLWEELLSAIRSRYSVGTATQSTLIQATQEQYSLRQETIELEAAIERSQSQFSRLGGFTQPLRLAVKDQLPNTELDALHWQQMIDHVSKQPQLMGVSAKQQKKEHELALAEKDRYPNFNVYARYNRLWQNEEQRWLFGVGFNLPFDLDKRSNRERGLRSESQALEWERQDLLAQLREQLYQAHSYWQQAKEIHALYQSQLLQLAEENLLSAQSDYQSGSESFLSLLTAQRQQLNTERKAAQAEHDQYAQFARLIAAAGILYVSDLTPADGAQGNTQAAAQRFEEQDHD